MVCQISRETSTTSTRSASCAEMTMSSREIAEVVELRHDSAKRTIERLAERGAIVQPPVVVEHVPDAMGRLRDVRSYLVNKRDSYVIVAQLSPEFTARLVDRWQELEKQVAQPQVPQSFAEALRLVWAAKARHRRAMPLKPQRPPQGSRW